MRKRRQQDDSNQAAASSAIQTADSGARARAFLLVGLIVAMGMPVIAASIFFEEQIAQWARNVAAPLVDRPELMFLALLVMVLPMIGISIYVYVQGGRIVRARRMPYPGQKVIKDTPIIEGDSAVKRGRAIQFIAVVMAVASLAVPFIPLVAMKYFS